MTIEEIEKEWVANLRSLQYAQDHEWMDSNILKLIAVAKAARPLRKYCIDSELNNPLLHKVVEDFDKSMKELKNDD